MLYFKSSMRFCSCQYISSRSAGTRPPLTRSHRSIYGIVSNHTYQITRREPNIRLYSGQSPLRNRSQSPRTIYAHIAIVQGPPSGVEVANSISVSSVVFRNRHLHPPSTQPPGNQVPSQQACSILQLPSPSSLRQSSSPGCGPR